jgi:DNA-binding transcriptional ArsR family regulator
MRIFDYPNKVGNMLTQAVIQEIKQLHADFCFALADATRMTLLYALADGPCNVGELTEELAVPQPSISRHLKTLRDLGLVIGTRHGMTVQYSLSDHRIIDALDILRSIRRDGLQRQVDYIDDVQGNI